MSRFKDFFKNLSIRQIVFSSICILSLVLFFGITVWSNIMISRLSDQRAANRWDKKGKSAQVSCYLTENAELDEFAIKTFEQELEKKISEIMTDDDSNPAAEKRLFIDAYSSMGKITIKSDKGKIDADAIGIGGDFFMFHPLQLISGKYFSGNDLMKDSVILDEDAAWQLFGSYDIVGKCIMIEQIPHYVSGVVRRDNSKMAKKAGLTQSMVYMSHESLSEYGTAKKINTFEIVAPNPVKKFLYTAVKEKLGIKEEDMVIVENSTRFSVESTIPVILEFGSRSMQNTAVRYPYWENIARGQEDIRSLILLLQFLFLLIPFIIIVVYAFYCWRHRKFTNEDVKNFLINKKDALVEYLRDKKTAKKKKLLEDKDEKENHTASHMCNDYDRDDSL